MPNFNYFDTYKPHWETCSLRSREGCCYNLAKQLKGLASVGPFYLSQKFSKSFRHHTRSNTEGFPPIRCKSI